MTNLVFLSGNIGVDPEVRNTHSGTQITSFTLATSRNLLRNGETVRGQDGYPVKDTEWHRIVCFNGIADSVAKYCEKGSRVQVTGRIHYTKWRDQNGVDRHGCEIIATSVEFLSRSAKPKAETASAVHEDNKVPF
ncbi:single-stranded DNA-binding protein [uncultured Bartonella sp.]|uniref:single-stranded DNA-binding protein n=1 Tax=uncultured Bartonella sp. TaxID=104108 RepID=UPI00260A2C09|nr:single-stranded DNA-binding protein [uncultured Bartonella sp.]